MVTQVTSRSRSAGQRSRSASAHTRSNGNGDLNLRGKPRHLSSSNCCNYCDKYHVGEMTHNKHRDIDDWRMDVNRNMANDQPPSRTRRTEESRKKYKLIYLKYSPPGSPDKDAGFRRVPVENGAKHKARTRSNWQADFDMDRLSTELDSISLEVADRSDFGHDFPSTMGSTTNKSSKTAKTTASAKSDATCLSQGTEFSRSNSNRLLNVLTIDDYKYRYGSTYSKVTDDLGNKSVPGGEAPLKRSASALSRSKQSQRGESAIQSGYNLNSDVTFDVHSNLSQEYQNETVERAYQVVMSSKKPVNNEAHRHLYPQPKVAPPGHSSKHSKRFNRLHRALHKWMEEEIIRPHSMRVTTSPQPLSTYSRMMDSPNWMNGAPDPGYSSAPSARRSSRKSRKSHLSSSNNDSGIISEEAELPPNRRDNNAFLEMLMEMEDSQTNHDTSFNSTASYARTTKEEET